MLRLPLFIKLAPMRVRDAAFALACRLLLPLSTSCKVCNMLRGMGIGILIGLAVAWTLDGLSQLFGWGLI